MSKKEYYVGIDLSLRNTAIVILDKDKNFISCEIISSNTLNDEALLKYNSMNISSFLSAWCWDYTDDGGDEFYLKGITLEELSFASKSAVADLIAANKWILRVQLLDAFPSIKLKQVSVKEWRSKVISAEEQKAINDRYPIIRAKRGLKLTKDEQKSNNKNKALIKKETKSLTVSKLPKEIKCKFEEYLLKHKFKVSSIEDLADSYWITCHNIPKES